MNVLLSLRHCLRLRRDHTRWLPPKATMATMLDTYGRDLTKVAASGDPVIGRDEEISRVVSILCCKSKNNAVLMGAAGVGKTTLNVAAMLAGTRYRGTFEDRMTGVIKQAEKEAQRGNAMDVSNMLKPALARGRIRCLGATTHDEYQRYFAKDKVRASVPEGIKQATQ
ncbi:hypothetical protein ACP70R_048989 [Stipagrostis hirtigluma subsp. patula]